jgi:hypothetical protein
MSDLKDDRRNVTRWAIRRRVAPHPDMWIGSVSGGWVFDWGSRRLWTHLDDAKYTLGELRKELGEGLKIFKITRIPAGLTKKR